MTTTPELLPGKTYQGKVQITIAGNAGSHLGDVRFKVSKDGDHGIIVWPPNNASKRNWPLFYFSDVTELGDSLIPVAPEHPVVARTEQDTATTFRVGDRVRRKNRVRVRALGIAGYLPEIGTIFEVAEAEGDYHVSHGREALRWTSGDDLELVERAHYAAPGVPVLALTPEVLEALETCIRQAEYVKRKSPHVLEMRAAIADAKKEAAR